MTSCFVYIVTLSLGPVRRRPYVYSVVKIHETVITTLKFHQKSMSTLTSAPSSFPVSFTVYDVPVVLLINCSCVAYVGNFKGSGEIFLKLFLVFSVTETLIEFYFRCE